MMPIINFMFGMAAKFAIRGGSYVCRIREFDLLYGYQGLSKFIQQEINKDVWILKNTSVKSIEWHFYWSSVSNSGGPSGPLLKELARYGIKVIFH